MKIITDNETLLSFIPNALQAVKGEQALFDKIQRFIDIAESWISANITGPETLDEIAASSNALYLATATATVAHAMMLAVPSLDLVLTPNGFGIVSNNTISPASKQRVDRLVGSLEKLRDDAIENMLSLLPLESNTWIGSERNTFFAATLFPNVNLSTLYGVTEHRWSKFLELRSQIIGIELSLAEDYFSPELMAQLRSLAIRKALADPQHTVVDVIRSQIIDVLKDKPVNCRRMVDVVNYIRYNPEIFPLWHNSETAKQFSPPKFENKKKASGYWF